MKLTPRLKPYFNYKETFAILNPFNKRGAVKRFESAFSKKFGCGYGTMFAHGRTGLYALFKVWGLKDDEIICPAYTCVVVQHAIALSGNVPVFVDSAKDSWNMNIDLMENAITPKTRAIVVTHLFGYPMDVLKVQEMVERAQKKYGNKIYVIQDVAHSFGAKWQNELVTKHGDAAIFGLNISKMLSSVFGGMVICNSVELDKKLKSYRNDITKGSRLIKSIQRIAYYLAVRMSFNSYIYGFINYLERNGLLDRFVKYYEDDRIFFPTDWDSPVTNTEASVGMIQLEKYDTIVEKRVKNALAYKQKFTNDSSIKFMPHLDGCTYSHCVALVGNREDWIERYRKKRIQLGILIEYSVPEMKAYQKFKRGDYPIAASYFERTINFPNWPNN